MENDLSALNRLLENFRIVDVALDKTKVSFDLFEVLSETGDQTIDDSYFCTGFDQTIRKVRADKTGSACYQYIGSK